MTHTDGLYDRGSSGPFRRDGCPKCQHFKDEASRCVKQHVYPHRLAKLPNETREQEAERLREHEQFIALIDGAGITRVPANEQMKPKTR